MQFGVSDYVIDFISYYEISLISFCSISINDKPILKT